MDLSSPWVACRPQSLHFICNKECGFLFWLSYINLCYLPSWVVRIILRDLKGQAVLLLFLYTLPYTWLKLPTVSKVTEVLQKRKPHSDLTHKAFTPLLQSTRTSGDFSSGGKSGWDPSHGIVKCHNSTEHSDNFICQICVFGIQPQMVGSEILHYYSTRNMGSKWNKYRTCGRIHLSPLEARCPSKFLNWQCCTEGPALWAVTLPQWHKWSLKQGEQSNIQALWVTSSVVLQDTLMAKELAWEEFRLGTLESVMCRWKSRRNVASLCE